MNQSVIQQAGRRLGRFLRPTRALCRFFLPLQPVSREFGADRGQPLDRYYIEQFLSTYQADITGDVLEVEESLYSRKFGQQVRSFNTLHLTEKVTPETIVADLSQPALLPQNRFDCFICTQTFHYIYDIDQGVEGTYRLLKPGGVLLATMPTVSQKSVSDDKPWKEYWRLTSDAAERAFGHVFGAANVTVEAYGNVLVAVAFLLGLAAQDLPQKKRDVYDPHYQCLVAVRAQKAPLP
jgi:SAM-dependent methyltransferase